MPAIIRKKREREKDLAFIASRYLRGFTQRKIQIALNEKRDYQLAPRTIGADIKEIHKRWLQSSLVDYDAAKSVQLAKIDNLEYEYWKAWHRSVGKAITTTHEEGFTSKGDIDKTTVKEFELVGDKKFLDGVQWCIEQRLKIFGIYEAVKVKIEADWRAEAEVHGIDAAAVFNELVSGYVEKLTEQQALKRLEAA